MSKKFRDISYVLVPTTDGVSVAFPVSKHLLDTSRVTPQRATPVLSLRTDDVRTAPRRDVSKVRHWKPTFMRKTASIALIFALFISSMGVFADRSAYTLAYFRDSESSLANLFSAALLDFLVADDVVARTITATTTPLIIPVMTPATSSIETLYKVTSEQTGGSATLCNALDMQATSSPFVYSGDLLSLNTTATTTTGAWTFGLTLATTTGLTSGDICNFDLIYRGWHSSMPEYTGFTDEERVHVAITYQATGSVFDIVLNEFLPNPDSSANGVDYGNDASNMPLGEWIEIYNNGDFPIDVSGWYMTDESGGVGNTHAFISATNTMPATTTVAAHSWLVVFLNKPSLNNTGDSIFFYTDDGILVDSYTYETVGDFCDLDLTPGNPNSTSTPTGIPGNGKGAPCSDNQVPPNKSYARIPDGTGDWIDPIPTPGFENTAENFPEEPAPDMSLMNEAPAEAAEPESEPEPEASEPEALFEELKEEAEEQKPEVENASPKDTGSPPVIEETPAPEDPPAEDVPPGDVPAEESPIDTVDEPVAEEPPQDAAPESGNEPAPEPAPIETPPQESIEPPPPVEPPPAPTPEPTPPPSE